MNHLELETKVTQAAPKNAPVRMNLELLVIPVSDSDRARKFYESIGWQVDIDHSVGDDYRIVQMSPPGSGCSIMFGTNIALAPPGSAQGMHLVVSDIEAARTDLLCRGVATSEPFHDVGGIFHHSNGKGIVFGPNPDRKSYASYFTFSDPDANVWTVQEVTARLPGTKGDTRFTTQLYEAVWGASGPASDA